MISYEQIMKLPGYQDLMSIGCTDIGSATLKKRGNIRFTHPTFGELSHWSGSVSGPAFVQIYQNGPVRGQGGDRQYKINSLQTDPLITKEDYNKKLIAVRKYLIKRILKNELGVSSMRQQNDIANKETVGETVVAMLQQLPTAFKHWIKDQDKTTQAGFLSADGIETALAAEIEKDPNKYAVLLKHVHNTEAIKKAIALLPPELGKKFGKDIGLTGDLAELGI